MSAHICPVVRLGEQHAIERADRLCYFDIVGSGPVVVAKTDFKSGDLAAFIPPESLVNTACSDFEFLKHKARKSDGWHKIRPIRYRGQLSVGLLMPAGNLAEGDNAAAMYRVKKSDDTDESEATVVDVGLWKKIKTWLRRKPAVKTPWPGIPVYDINQLYKMRSVVFEADDLVVVTEKLHGTNARYVIGKDGNLWCGSRNGWKKPGASDVYNRSAIDYDIERKLRRLGEPLVLWGEIIGPSIQKGFDYGIFKGSPPGFKAFDFYHATEHRFLSPCETKDICHWLKIDMVPIVMIDTWGLIEPDLRAYAMNQCMIDGAQHPREGVVVRPWLSSKTTSALDGSNCLLAGKIINPEYLEYRGIMDPKGKE